MGVRSNDHQRVSGKQYFEHEVQNAGNTGSTIGSGFTAATYQSSLEINGNLAKWTIWIDIAGSVSKNTDGDIIGTDDTANAHIGQIPSGVTWLGGKVTCLEAPTTGEPDLNLYEAVEGTLAEDSAIGDGTETILLDRNGDWAINDIKSLSAAPTAGEYLYLSVGTNSSPTAGTYDAGIFLMEFYGTQS